MRILTLIVYFAVIVFFVWSIVKDADHDRSIQGLRTEIETLKTDMQNLRSLQVYTPIGREPEI